MPRKSILAAFCLLVLTGCQNQENAAAPCRIGLATELRLTYDHGTILTPAVLNGAEVNMVLDTGSQITTLSQSSVDRLHIGLEPVHGEISGIGGSRELSAFYASRFKIGRLQGHDLELAVSDLQLYRHGHPIDGLFGSDFLVGYDLDLDFPDHAARLYKVVQGCTHPAAVLDEPLFQADLLRNSNSRDSRPFTRVEIDGKTLTALIDTGAQHSLIFRNAAARLGLRLDDLGSDPHFRERGVGPNSPQAVRHVMTPIAVGEITISHFPVALVDQRSDDGTGMLLGVDFLGRVHAWISNSSHTLLMQYPPKPSLPLQSAALR